MADPRKPTRTRRTNALIVGGVVIVLVSGGAWWLVQSPPAPRSAPPPAPPPPHPPAHAHEPEQQSLVPGPKKQRPAPRPTTTILFEDGCTSSECHAEYLTAEYVHGPVAVDACDLCHAPDRGGHVYPVRLRPDDICMTCHETDLSHEFRHTEMVESGCLACHTPHASSSPDLLTEPTVGATCAACHPVATGRAVHQPYEDGDCTACHGPHAEDNRFLLRAGGSEENCRMCHAQTAEAMRSTEMHHCEISGGCVQCHAWHASDWPGLLHESSATQCLRCHEQVRKTIESSPVMHQALMTDRRCVTCHLPHASQESAMLRGSQIVVCLSCHDTPVEALDGRTIPDMTPLIETAEHPHGPVDHGQCTLCHSVHGSTHSRLLRGDNPEIVIGRFDARNYSLCFSCHDKALVTEQQTTSVTAFRDGTLNLHYLHVVNDGRARSCSTCHVVHGGKLPKLLAEYAAFEGSDWKMSLGFALTDRGGSCSPGCHEPLAYDRMTGSP